MHSLQQNVPDNWYEHANGLTNVGNSAAPAGRRDRRPQEIVEPENVYYVEVPQSRAAKSCNPGIPAQPPEVQPVRQVNHLDPAFLQPPSPTPSLPTAPPPPPPPPLQP